MVEYILELPNEILFFLFSVIGILSVVATAFRWKTIQIQNETKRNMTLKKDNEDIAKLKDQILELCNRVARFEGAFSQHSKESTNRSATGGTNL